MYSVGPRFDLCGFDCFFPAASEDTIANSRSLDSGSAFTGWTGCYLKWLNFPGPVVPVVLIFIVCLMQLVVTDKYHWPYCYVRLSWARWGWFRRFFSWMPLTGSFYLHGSFLHLEGQQNESAGPWFVGRGWECIGSRASWVEMWFEEGVCVRWG